MVASCAKRVVGGIVLAALIVFLGACGTTSLDGTSTSTRASVSGRIVSRTTGAALTDVPVRIASTIVHTDRLGQFAIPNVRVGTCTLAVDAAGYEEYSQAVEVRAGLNAVGDIALLDLPPDPPVF